MLDLLNSCIKLVDYNIDWEQTYNGTISADVVFLQIFNNTDMRLMFFNIMPSDVASFFIDPNYIPDQLAKYDVESSSDINMVIAKFINYINIVYNAKYTQVQNNIKKQYKLTNEDPLIYTLVENIKRNKWNLNEVRFYIISLYQNDLVDWKTPLSRKV